WMGRGGEDGDTAAPATDEQVEQEDVAEHPSEVAQPDLSHEEARDPDDLLAEGPVDAPVVLVVFTDFQCPYCARWSHETLPELREYVDRGELRIEWRDVNIYGDDSERAARAALAAAKQCGLEEYHDMPFDRGGLRLEGRAVNIYGEDSERAARAALEAAKQGGMEEYHAMLVDGGEIRTGA